MLPLRSTAQRLDRQEHLPKLPELALPRFPIPPWAGQTPQLRLTPRRVPRKLLELTLVPPQEPLPPLGPSLSPPQSSS